MEKKPTDETFEVTELDDKSLDDVIGGAEAVTNLNCGAKSCTNTNCVAGCACGAN